MLFTKIRYRLVFNRAQRLNKDGRSVVQIEASQNRQKKYFSTRVYLEADQWDYSRHQVINHGNSDQLNAYLYELKLKVEQQELLFWKLGKDCTLEMLKDSVKGKEEATENFVKFAMQAIHQSKRKKSTKENLLSTVRLIEKWNKSLTLQDLTRATLSAFERHIHSLPLHPNTVNKHLRNLRTLINEGIHRGLMRPEQYPFKQYKLEKTKSTFKNLSEEEVGRIKKVKTKGKEEHVRDAFLFCCYTGLRFSDLQNLKEARIETLHKKKWLMFKSMKTGVDTMVPLEMLFSGQTLDIMDRYGQDALGKVGCNADANRLLKEVAERAGITRKVTFHAARHTCATMLIRRRVPITTVQRILGHTDVKTTQIYAETTQDTIERNIHTAFHEKRRSANFAVNGPSV